MKPPLLPLLALGSVLGFAACDRQIVVVEKAPATPLPEPVARTKTLETSRLGSAVDDFEREPSAARRATVKKAFAELDGEIAELQEYIAKHGGEERAKAAAKLQNLQSYRAAESARFTAAEAKGTASDREPADARSGTEKVEDSARKAGNAIEDAAKKTGDAIKDAVR
jgi:hypothetical protein